MDDQPKFKIWDYAWHVKNVDSGEIRAVRIAGCQWDNYDDIFEYSYYLSPEKGKIGSGLLDAPIIFECNENDLFPTKLEALLYIQEQWLKSCEKKTALIKERIENER